MYVTCPSLPVVVALLTRSGHAGWDLETNQVVRDYYGHLSGVYCISVHPTLDLIMTGGRDGSVRVRTRRRPHLPPLLGRRAYTHTHTHTQCH